MERQNKHKTKRRIIATICVSILLLYVLAVPTYAVISVSRGEGSDYVISASSSFPMTLGFVYRSSPNSTYNYTLCTDIGGFGQEYPRTYYGDDVVMYYYDELGEAVEVQRSILYQFESPYVSTNQTYIDSINGNKVGYYPLLISSTTKDSDQEVTTIVIRADDIVYNTALLDLYKQAEGSYSLAELGYCGIPTLKLNELLDDSTTEKLAGTISIHYYIQGSNPNERERVAFTYSVDTSLTNNNIPLLSVDNLKKFDAVKNPRLLITDYECYIDVDYYEYVEEPLTNNQKILGNWSFKNYAGFEYDSHTPLVYCTEEGYNNILLLGSVGHYEYMVGTPYEDNYDIYMNYSYDGVHYVGVDGYAGALNFGVLKNELPSTSGFAASHAGSATLQFNDNVLNSNIIVTDVFANFIVNFGIPQGGQYSANGEWKKIESTYPNSIYLTLPTYDTSGAYMSDSAKVNAQKIYFSFPDTPSYVNNLDVITLEEMDMTSWLSTATKGFLDFELWDNFTLGGILAILVTIPLMIWVLKLFAGG